MRSTLLVWGNQWIQIGSEHVRNCQVRLVLYHPPSTKPYHSYWNCGKSVGIGYHTVWQRYTRGTIRKSLGWIFSCYEHEDETFLLPMPVVDETWVHSCDPDLVASKWTVSQRITLPMNTLTGTGSAESHVHCGLQLWEYPSWHCSECCYYKNFWNVICIPHCIVIISLVVRTCCAPQHCSLSQF